MPPSPYGPFLFWNTQAAESGAYQFGIEMLVCRLPFSRGKLERDMGNRLSQNIPKKIRKRDAVLWKWGHFCTNF